MISQALAELGKKRFLLAIHDASFPSDPDEDIGRGAPTTRAAARLFAHVRALGFTGIQLGPQGQTERGNPSPYDSTIFSRHLATISIASCRAGGPYAGLVDDAALDGILWRHGGRANHAHAFDASRALIDAACTSIALRTTPLARRVAELLEPRNTRMPWLWREIAFLQSEPGGEDAFRYALGQMFAHEEHARLRRVVGELGLTLYGDMQVGYSRMDASIYASAFLHDYRMGAPPSRTNPDGQPWNYPVLDPDQLDAGAARDLLAARIDKVFTEYDSVRIDHPHGLVCPWVYRVGDNVANGTRLYESPDHEDLARFAIAHESQIDWTRPRYHDDWVTELADDQIARYAKLFDLFAECAARHGRAMADVSCEVLSTMPMPLAKVLERHGLGRWRVTQKANLDNPNDVYRSEMAQRADWVMLGNHDTAPIFALIRAWPAATRDKWIEHLTKRLRPHDARWTDDRYLASAMLAELFVCPAENVSIFWADLFGSTERFNAPGTVSDENWTLRLPPDFARLRGLDIGLALAIALEAKGSTSGLASKLRDSVPHD